MAGLGAAEGDIRPDPRDTDNSNFYRRSARAQSLLNENRDQLRRWAAREDVEPISVDSEAERAAEIEAAFIPTVDYYIRPLYALVLQTYLIYLTGRHDPMDALRALNEYAAETRLRGSWGMKLACLLLAGTTEGRQLALSIMKFPDASSGELSYAQTVKNAWNTSFDLVYSHLATAIPTWGAGVPEPVVFITADQPLSAFLNMVTPLGGAQTSDGTVLPLNAAFPDGTIRDDLYEDVAQLMLDATAATYYESLPAERVQEIRRVKSLEHAERLEQLFKERHASEE